MNRKRQVFMPTLSIGWILTDQAVMHIGLHTVIFAH